jgi:hypothetical protein
MIKSLYIAPLALVVSTVILGASASPAMAAAATCATTPAKVRAAAATATPDQQKKALQLVSVGEKLCAENSDFEASKKFAAAAKALGTDLASLPAVVAAQ